jgi:hypothetical protein
MSAAHTGPMGAVERRGSRYQVQYRLGDRLYSGDLVFRDGQPTLVISWKTVEWKRVPYICLPLDASRLKQVNPEIYVYEGELS